MKISEYQPSFLLSDDMSIMRPGDLNAPLNLSGHFRYQFYRNKHQHTFAQIGLSYLSFFSVRFVFNSLRICYLFASYIHFIAAHHDCTYSNISNIVHSTFRTSNFIYSLLFVLLRSKRYES